MADLYVKLGRNEEALSLYEQSLKTLETLKDPREIAVTQINLAQHLINWQKNLPHALELLWKGYEQIARIGNPREVAQVQEIIQAFRQQQGTRFVPLWESALADKPIPQWLKMGTRGNASATLPREVVQNWCQNTLAVKTAVSERLAEWRNDLLEIREKIANQGADYAQEGAFVDALLAILDDRPVDIPADNPYADVIQQTQQAIEAYQSNTM